MSRDAAHTLICPVCRRPPEAWTVEQGTLTCTNPDCGQTFPRIHERIPVLIDGTLDAVRVSDVVGDLEPLDALTDRVEGMDLASEEREAFFRSTMYVVSHYRDRPNLYTELCDRLLPLVGAPVESAVDLGCGVGGLAIEVAHRTGASVVGLDGHPLMLRWAERAARGEPFWLPVRRTAASFELRRIDPPVPPSPGSVRWVCTNVLDPPLPAESFDLVLAVNVVDTVSDPAMALGQASALLRPGGHLILAQPDAWTASNTPPENWLAEDSAGWDRVLAGVGLETLATIDGLDWVLGQTDRLSFGYRLHARIAVRGEWPDS